MPLLTVQAYANETAAIKENLSYPFIRGGENHGLREEEFAVEKGVKEITVHWLSNHSSGNIKLTDPHGKPLKDFSKAKTADVFEGDSSIPLPLKIRQQVHGRSHHLSNKKRRFCSL